MGDDRIRVYYDFHIHSALSPCADNDMTPNNIVNMAKLKGLDAIALTDHNCAANIEATAACARQAGLVFLPGMEVETAEEVHVLALFDTPRACLSLQAYLDEAMVPVKNRKEIYGEQLILDEYDQIVGEHEPLLVTARMRSVYEVVDAILIRGGAAVAAHIDRSSYSVLSNLGTLPEDLAFCALEVSAAGDIAALKGQHPGLAGHRLLTSSDAHNLGALSERSHCLMLETNSASAIISYLRGGL